MKEAEDIDERLHTPGVYLIFGEEISTATPIVYAGEGEDVFKRINQKHTYDEGDKKYHWDDAIIFVSLIDGGLDKAKIKYLESRFHEIASDVKRFISINGNTPTKSTLASEDLDGMEQFIENAKIILSVTCYNVFVQKSTPHGALEVQPPAKPKKKQAKKKDLLSLPNESKGPCPFAKETLKNLLASGYVFSEEQIAAFSSVEGSKPFAKLNLPLFWILKEGESYNTCDKSIRERYWKEEFTSGGYRFLMYSQWYNNPKKGSTKEDLKNWYNSLTEE